MMAKPSKDNKLVFIVALDEAVFCLTTYIYTPALGCMWAPQLLSWVGNLPQPPKSSTWRVGGFPCVQNSPNPGPEGLGVSCEPQGCRTLVSQPSLILLAPHQWNQSHQYQKSQMSGRSQQIRPEASAAMKCSKIIPKLQDEAFLQNQQSPDYQFFPAFSPSDLQEEIFSQVSRHQLSWKFHERGLFSAAQVVSVINSIISSVCYCTLLLRGPK